MGSIQDNFHFLGIPYSLTQPENNTSVKHANDDVITASPPVYSMSKSGAIVTQQQHVALRHTQERYAKPARM
jgi:hypothetical protein